MFNDNEEWRYCFAAEQYAFIWDSAVLEYVASQKPCNKIIVGGLFNQFGYGIALRKHSHHTNAFSLQILQ